MRRTGIRAALAAALLALLLAPGVGRAELSPAIQKELQSSTYVYIASTRKSGQLGQPAEIWFMYHDGAV